jgi:hypothetical protein
LFVFLRITDSDHPFGIFIVKHMLTVYFWNYRSIITDLPQLSLYPNSNDFVIDISVRSLLSLRGCWIKICHKLTFMLRTLRNVATN